MSHLFTPTVITENAVDTASYDAFNRTRTSSPFTLFSDRGLTDNQLLWSSVVSGAGASIDTSNSHNSSQLDLVVGTVAGESAIRQSRQSSIYQPGNSQLCMLSFRMDPKTNVRHRVGYFTGTDGVYLEHDGIEPHLVIRSSSSGTLDDTSERIPQSQWNIDGMAGAGPSQFSVDFTKSQVLVIDLGWLGVGRVRVGFVSDGAIKYAHQFNHTNSLTSTYMGHAALPIRYEIENTGVTTGETRLASIYQCVMAEGGQQNQGLTYSTDSGASISLTSGTWTPIMSVRLNPLYKHGAFDLIKAELLNTSNTFVQYKLLVNATLTGAVWTNGPGQVVQYDQSSTAVTGGTAVDAGYISQKDTPELAQRDARWKGGVDVLGVPDTLTLIAKPVASNSNVYASLTWKELY